MRLCVTSRGRDLDAMVEPRFGRAPFFLVMTDPEGGGLVTVENPNVDARGGVGPRSVQILVDQRVETLVTGQMGANALAAIRAAGIQVFSAPDGIAVSEALSLYRKGTLERIA